MSDRVNGYSQNERNTTRLINIRSNVQKTDEQEEEKNGVKVVLRMELHKLPLSLHLCVKE